MTVAWIVIEIMFLALFYQLPSAVEPATSGENNEQSTRVASHQIQGTEEEEKGQNGFVAAGVPSTPKEEKKKKPPSLAKSGKLLVSLNANAGEASPLLRDPHRNANYSINRPNQPDTEAGSEVRGASRLARARGYVRFVMSRMVREEIVVLLAVIFLTIFSQTVIEVSPE